MLILMGDFGNGILFLFVRKSIKKGKCYLGNAKCKTCAKYVLLLCKNNS